MTEGYAQELSARDVSKSALISLAILLRRKEIRISLNELQQHASHLEEINDVEIKRTLKDLHIKSRWVTFDERNLETMPLPGLLRLRTGEYALVSQVSDGKVLLQGYKDDRAKSIAIADLVEISHPSILLVTNDDEAKSIDQQAFGFKWFFTTLFKYSRVMKETLFASFFIQLFALITPLFFMIVIDKVFAHNNLSTLDVLVFAMVVVAAFDVVLSGVRTYLMSHTTSRVDLELGVRLFRHMMKLPLSYYESRKMGETIARVREMETIRNFLTGSTLTLMIDLLFLFVFLFVMFLFSKTLFLIVLVSLPLFFLVSFFVTPMMKSKLEDKHQKLSENQSFLVETLGGIETIKSSSVEGHHQREYENKLAGIAKCSFNSSNLSNLINQTTSFISKGLTITLLYVGANAVISGDLSVGQLIAFNMLTGRVVQPIQRLAQIWQEFTSMKVSVQRVADILDAPTEPVMLKGKTENAPLQGKIELKDVGFAYKIDGEEVLSNINLNVKEGEVVGVVGSTGSSKTTLIKLIQRLYVPTKGKILIDGINIASVDGTWLRKQIGVVAQDFVLFNKSIRDNIALGNLDITDEEIMQTAQHVGVHEMIMGLPDGYDTMLQERGRGLSTGQRQAIALARALVTDPRILILDEATSALDYESEQKFQKNFKTICKGRTTFVVAHRLSTVSQADRIITLENGEIVENDTPENLLKAGGRFSKLYEIHQSTWSKNMSMSEEETVGA